MNIEEVLELRAQGWTFQEIQLGKGWQQKYPHLAAWPGGIAWYSSPRTPEPGRIEGCRIELRCTDESRMHSINTVVMEASITTPSNRAIAEEANELIREWFEEHGREATDFYRKAWNREGDWDVKYPHIQNWARLGKRHCIQIDINLATGKNQVKAWHYDKPTDYETVLFESDVNDAPEKEVLRILDDGIADWLRNHPNSGLMEKADEN